MSVKLLSRPVSPAKEQNGQAASVLQLPKHLRLSFGDEVSNPDSQEDDRVAAMRVATAQAKVREHDARTQLHLKDTVFGKRQREYKERRRQAQAQALATVLGPGATKHVGLVESTSSVSRPRSISKNKIFAPGTSSGNLTVDQALHDIKVPVVPPSLMRRPSGPHSVLRSFSSMSTSSHASFISSAPSSVQHRREASPNPVALAPGAAALGVLPQSSSSQQLVLVQESCPPHLATAAAVGTTVSSTEVLVPAPTSVTALVKAVDTVGTSNYAPHVEESAATTPPLVSAPFAITTGVPQSSPTPKVQQRSSTVLHVVTLSPPASSRTELPPALTASHIATPPPPRNLEVEAMTTAPPNNVASNLMPTPRSHRSASPSQTVPLAQTPRSSSVSPRRACFADLVSQADKGTQAAAPHVIVRSLPEHVREVVAQSSVQHAVSAQGMIASTISAPSAQQDDSNIQVAIISTDGSSQPAAATALEASQAQPKSPRWGPSRMSSGCASTIDDMHSQLKSPTWGQSRTASVASPTSRNGSTVTLPGIENDVEASVVAKESLNAQQVKLDSLNGTVAQWSQDSTIDGRGAPGSPLLSMFALRSPLGTNMTDIASAHSISLNSTREQAARTFTSPQLSNVDNPQPCASPVALPSSARIACTSAARVVDTAISTTSPKWGPSRMASTSVSPRLQRSTSMQLPSPQKVSDMTGVMKTFSVPQQNPADKVNVSATQPPQTATTYGALPGSEAQNTMVASPSMFTSSAASWSSRFGATPAQDSKASVVSKPSQQSFVRTQSFPTTNLEIRSISPGRSPNASDVTLSGSATVPLRSSRGVKEKMISTTPPMWGPSRMANRSLSPGPRAPASVSWSSRQSFSEGIDAKMPSCSPLQDSQISMVTSPSILGATVAKWSPSSLGTAWPKDLQEAARDLRAPQQSDTPSSPFLTTGSRSVKWAPARPSSRSPSPTSPATVRLGGSSSAGSPLFQYSYSTKLSEPVTGSPWGRNEVGRWLRRSSSRLSAPQSELFDVGVNALSSFRSAKIM